MSKNPDTQNTKPIPPVFDYVKVRHVTHFAGPDNQKMVRPTERSDANPHVVRCWSKREWEKMTKKHDRDKGVIDRFSHFEWQYVEDIPRPLDNEDAKNLSPEKTGGKELKAVKAYEAALAEWKEKNKTAPAGAGQQS